LSYNVLLVFVTMMELISITLKTLLLKKIKLIMMTQKVKMKGLKWVMMMITMNKYFFNMNLTREGSFYLLHWEQHYAFNIARNTSW